jgi:outer membrane protein assembly factor BamB
MSLRLWLIASVFFARTVSGAVEGTWKGTVTAPQGPAELALVFTRTEKGLVAAVHLPVMLVHGARFGATEASDREIKIAALNTTLRATGDAMHGEFALGKLPLALRRGGQLPPAAAPAPAFPAAPPPRWQYPLGSATWASPLASDAMIYIGTVEGKFHAVRAADGRAAWTWSGPNRIDGRAVASADAIYFIDGKIDLVCLARADGALRWRAPLHDAALAGKPAPDNPTFNRPTATPLVIDDVVYAGSSDGGLYALDAVSGQKRWRFDAKSPVFPGLARDGADRLLCGCMDGCVVKLDRPDGREISRVRAGGAVLTTPVLAGGNLFVGSRDYTFYAFRAGDGALAWKFSYWFSWVESTPAVSDGTLYVGASDYRRVTSFDPANGTVHWATDVRGLA